MELWIIIAILAAFFQNIRSTFQKHVKGTLSNTGATFVRFGFGIPFAFLYLAITLWWFDVEVPTYKVDFWIWVFIAAFSQIFATGALLHAFSFRNFAVGTAYSRTEPIQTALFAAILFGEVITLGGWISIIVSLIGVLILSIARSNLNMASVLSGVSSKAAIWGLIAGTLFGLAAVGYRQSTQQITSDLFLVRASITLCVAISLQSLVMFAWILWRNPTQVKKILKVWKPSLLIGFSGATASFGWFTAFTLQQAALVKVVAQIEMLFTIASSVFFFKEQINSREYLGCILISLGIMLLILLG